MNLSKEDNCIWFVNCPQKSVKNCCSEQILAQLVHTSNPQFKVKVPNVTKQSGNYECGLFAFACITYLAHGLDPSLFVFHQETMRNHFIQCSYRKPIHNSVSNNQEKKAVNDGQYTIAIDVLPLALSRWWIKDGNYFVIALVASSIIWLNCLKQDSKRKPMLKTQKWYCCTWICCILE